MNTIIIHHAGGLKNHPHASTYNLTPQHISDAHKIRWNFPSEHITDETIRYAGYNIIYDPKTREFTQCRAISEETAHTKGMNFNSLGLCIIGNYNTSIIGSPRRSIDTLQEHHVNDILKFIYDLLDDNARELEVVSGTKLNFSIGRVYAHKFFSHTDCHGTFFADDFFRKQLYKFKPLRISDTPSKRHVYDLTERIGLLQKFLKLQHELYNLLVRRKLKTIALGATDDRECDGFISR